MYKLNGMLLYCYLQPVFCPHYLHSTLDVITYEQTGMNVFNGDKKQDLKMQCKVILCNFQSNLCWNNMFICLK